VFSSLQSEILSQFCSCLGFVSEVSNIFFQNFLIDSFSNVCWLL
jgi:hypothetical protein